MEFLLAIVALGALVWTIWFMLRGSLVMGGAVLILVGAVFGYQFWHSEGGFPLSADRVLVGLLAATYVLRRISHTADPKPLGRAEWVLLALIGVLAFSTFTHDWHKMNSLAMAHLVLYWLMPAAVYWVARQSPLDARGIRGMFVALLVLGIYLTATALAEGTGQLWAVFPQYIASPEHQFFGRARGPFLNPSAMGIYLSVGLVTALCFWPHASRRGQLLLIVLACLTMVGIFATLTRSAWMGGGLALVVFMTFTLPRKWRTLLITVGAVAALAMVTVNWDSFWNLKRDENLDASAAAESAELRPLLADIAWKMFLDRPLLGVGYGQYDFARMPYIADRSSAAVLDKTLPYTQHNAFLALLVETGLVGMGLFVLLLVLWTRNAWALWSNRDAPLWIRQSGLLLMATIAAYIPNAMFQDTNIIDGVNLLLFFLAGVTAGLAANAAFRIQGSGAASQGAAVKNSNSGAKLSWQPLS